MKAKVFLAYLVAVIFVGETLLSANSVFAQNRSFHNRGSGGAYYAPHRSGPIHRGGNYYRGSRAGHYGHGRWHGHHRRYHTGGPRFYGHGGYYGRREYYGHGHRGYYPHYAYPAYASYDYYPYFLPIIGGAFYLMNSLFPPYCRNYSTTQIIYRDVPQAVPQEAPRQDVPEYKPPKRDRN